MTVGKFFHFLAVVLIALTITAVPADAHKKPKAQAAPVSAPATQPANASVEVTPAGPAMSEDEHMAGMMEVEAKERATMSSGERLLDWLGRLHPVIVHFPIAFFPAALFTAIVGRRRPAFGQPVQFLVVAGAIIAPIAAILGWLNAIGADPDPLLTVHRWLGTALGVAALPLGIWAWRRPDQVRGTMMIVTLSLVTAAIVVQAWYGGALVHGMDHLNW